ncbi:phenylalanine--tRNA ligase subunit beta [Ginsengibacter hankyongi]|uniref:Phenylalanine--tRNA ligase beta subunit n=1 Tax=Ginsengibacter hankyongi TaxID=2607284 RepID=A0A5J5IKN6_9BACT|nr:phenylalanine--tRNA ligase subunit beta [Ginsengibacter hankyongi]KAA9041586.1 phenylalanine--tRNA ligase subunit beta [Ginsengibacter hankyongi]
MKISYSWLRDYLPEEITSKLIKSPQKVSEILTSVGLEVENLEYYEEIKSSLAGLVVGEILTCEKHPDADKLKITTVNNGKGETLQIVCGANNVAAGQKVIIAPSGTTLYPINGEPLIIKKTKIRGIESNGMICAEDEIGIGESHRGIIVLPDDVEPGTEASDFFKPYNDWIFEIGLTPNRMDAMSHLGVAKDVCAYLSHHNRADIKINSPFNTNFKNDNTSQKINVIIENKEGCSRYAGVSISGIRINTSPAWLQNRLKSIGVRPINNIVDITNFILHETGQPLHAFDADEIKGNSIIVKTLPEGTKFITLDEKTRSVNREDIMICNGEGEPMCFGGVFGGLESGVTNNTVNIFLESAWFNPAYIRKTSFRHNLRTEAATRFEKGVDISNTVNVLKRAAQLIKDICGGKISSEIIDIYPVPKKQNEISLQNHYLKKISGKNYHQDTVKNILKSLNFSILKEGIDEIRIAAPFSNPDITLPADVIEEIMRIDGLDNIEIPATIKMAPAIETGADEASLKEKIAGWLTGNGFSEIFTNSITNSKYFDEQVLSKTVIIINSLSEELNVMRPSMMPTGLESIAYNINRKNADLLFFEFGKIYAKTEQEKYVETESLAIYFTGNKKENDWKNKGEKTGIYFAKGVCEIIFKLAGVTEYKFSNSHDDFLNDCIMAAIKTNSIAKMGSIKNSVLEKFSIKQPVFYLYLNWQQLLSTIKVNQISFEEIPKFPQVQRDLSIIVDKSASYQALEESIKTLKISKLKEFKLFDVFESEKLGANKKSMAISFTFSDKEKTLTDNETDAMMNKIINSIEKNMEAEIRRNS